jgi:recombinational DNA repair ATPase RecF
MPSLDDETPACHSAPDFPAESCLKVRRMTNPPSVSTSSAAATAAPLIYSLSIERYRGIEALKWQPAKGVNLILGGGDVGKTTILEAIARLLSPTNAMSVSDTDYYLKDTVQVWPVTGDVQWPPSEDVDQERYDAMNQAILSRCAKGLSLSRLTAALLLLHDRVARLLEGARSRKQAI